MQTHLLGYPRIGSNRELKKACEQYWTGKIVLDELLKTGKEICKKNLKIQKEAGIDLIPCNDFSFYDQVLDLSLTLGAIPKRYNPIAEEDIYCWIIRTINNILHYGWLGNNFINSNFQKNLWFSQQSIDRLSI